MKHLCFHWKGLILKVGEVSSWPRLGMELSHMLHTGLHLLPVKCLRNGCRLVSLDIFHQHKFLHVLHSMGNFLNLWTCWQHDFFPRVQLQRGNPKEKTRNTNKVQVILKGLCDVGFCLLGLILKFMSLGLQNLSVLTNTPCHSLHLALEFLTFTWKVRCLIACAIPLQFLFLWLQVEIPYLLNRPCSPQFHTW